MSDVPTPPPPPQGTVSEPKTAPASRHSTKKLVVIAALTFLVGLLIGTAAGSSANTNTVAAPSPAASASAVVTTTATAPATTSSPTSSSPAPPPNPEGKYGLASCDWNPGAGLSAGEFIGSTRVHNTGQVALTAVVTFAWLMGDGSKLSADRKTVSVQPGAEKLVFFSHAATQTLVGNFQSHPDYSNSKNCSTKATIK